jgi:hypothetical protein
MTESHHANANQAGSAMLSKFDTSYAFVLSPVEVTCSLPATLCNGLILKRANDDQIERVRNKILGIVPDHPPAWSPTQWYECNVSSKGSASRATPLPGNKWRYYIVDNVSSNGDLHNLQLVANIVNPPIDIISLQFLAGGGAAYHPTSIFNLLTPPFRLQPPAFDETSLSHICDAFGLIAAIQTDHGEIYRILTLYDDLRMVHTHSAMRALGVFSVIEALITHAPGKYEVGDSLNHQVSTKMPLLSKRFQTPLDYECFQEASEKTIWQKLYGYRSALAHGRNPDFAKDLKILIDQSTATNFITQAVMTMLRHAITEPQFYLDLREC